MPQFDITKMDVLGFIQSVHPPTLIKWVFLLILIGYTIFTIIVFRQIKSMDEVITQPVSSTIVSTVSLSFIAVGILLLIFVWMQAV